MLWLKAFHVVFMVAWFAGIFYLPRLFVYHAMSEDQASIDRFKIMERKLYNGIMTPSAVLTVFSGLWMLYEYAWKAYSPQKWLHVKLFLVILLIAYHAYCGYLVKLFREDRNRQKHTFYRIINELPVLILIGVVIMVIVRPF